MNEETLKKIETLISPILENLGYHLIEAEPVFEYGRSTLRIYVEKEGSPVTIEDCAKVSHAVEDLIAVEDIIEGAYNLEVSSPGLARPLKSKKDFEKYLGRTVKIKTKEPINGRANYKGTLEHIKDDVLFVTIDGQMFEITIEKIAKAKLVPDI